MYIFDSFKNLRLIWLDGSQNPAPYQFFEL